MEKETGTTSASAAASATLLLLTRSIMTRVANCSATTASWLSISLPVTTARWRSRARVSIQQIYKLWHTLIILGGVKMNSTNGQVLTWHEDCLQCSVCYAGISLDNVVFRDKLFCKSCYLDTILNKCDKCEKVGSARVSSTALGSCYLCFSQSLELASPSEESSGTIHVLHVISVRIYFKRGSLET